IASLVTAVIVYRALPETRPTPAEGETEQTMSQTLGGYWEVIRDLTFVWYLGASMLMALVYMQMNSTLAVYLRDTHGVPEQGFGYILSLNAAMVVLFQFPIMRWIEKYRPLVIMAVGTLLYAIGFGMYGFVATFPLFLLAMVVITIGEMLVSPVGQAIVAKLAPEDMRGRYMAVAGFGWVIPSTVGPLLAGLIMDNADPRWVWYAAGLIGLLAAAAFAMMERWVGRSLWAAIDERLDIMEMLEEGKISAAEAARRLEAAPEGSWNSLVVTHAGSGERRHLRIRVGDPASGTMKMDLRLPLALANTVLHMGGKLADELPQFDLQSLEEIIAEGQVSDRARRVATDGDDVVEVSVE
ncbi:MAG: MFS transporter, partial [Chloroflexi bacterium]|nr:MFS transporter [Chloroflexota bacterium]